MSGQKVPIGRQDHNEGFRRTNRGGVTKHNCVEAAYDEKIIRYLRDKHIQAARSSLVTRIKIEDYYADKIALAIEKVKV